MVSCKICLINEANQTGSHMFPASNVETMIGKRGQEKGYSIDASPTLDYLKNSGANAIIEDFVFCMGCEKRLAYLESYINQEFFQKAWKSKYRDNFQKITSNFNNEIQYPVHVNKFAFHLYVIAELFKKSISSASAFIKFKMPIEIEERYGCYLNETLPPYLDFKVKPDKKKWLKGLEDIFLAFNQTPKFTFIIPNTRPEGKRSFLTCPEFLTMPYSLLLNEFIVYVHIDSIKFENQPSDLFGMGIIQTDMEGINHKEDEHLKIVKINDLLWDNMIMSLINVVKTQKINALRTKCREEYLKKGIRLTDETIDKIVYEKLSAQATDWDRSHI